LVRRAKPGGYQNFALPAVQQVISAITSGVPVIYYTKASSHLMPAGNPCGASVLSVDWRADLAALRKTLGPKIALQVMLTRRCCLARERKSEKPRISQWRRWVALGIS